ncbi:hypothetical protein RBB50_008377 [Rhinocladiella similis]
MGAGTAERDTDAMPGSGSYKPDVRRTGRRIQKAPTTYPRGLAEGSKAPLRKSGRLQREPSTEPRRITGRRRGVGVSLTPKKEQQQQQQQHQQQQQQQQQYHHSRREHKKQSTTSSSSSSSSRPPRTEDSQNAKRGHFENKEDDSPRQGNISRKDQYIEHWLDNILSPGKSSTSQFDTVLNPPHRAPTIITVPDSLTPPGTLDMQIYGFSSCNSMACGAALEVHNILIEKARPPPELERRALEILSGLPTSADMDLTAIENLRQVLMRDQDQNESHLITLFSQSGMTPSSFTTLDPRLRVRENQSWFKCVPIPPVESIRLVVSDHPTLPKPRPDFAFGFDPDSFNLPQKIALQALVDQDLKQSYSMPDTSTVFPFLILEFKSEATNGNHHVARIQAASSGAIALNGILHLMERSLGLRAFGKEEPHHFSITIDYSSARVNLHWVEVPGDGGPNLFHVNALAHYPLMHADALLALSRAIRNILDYGVNTRLPKISAALDAYQKKILRGSAKAKRRKK